MIDLKAVLDKINQMSPQEINDLMKETAKESDIQLSDKSTEITLDMIIGDFLNDL